MCLNKKVLSSQIPTTRNSSFNQVDLQKRLYQEIAEKWRKNCKKVAEEKRKQ